ncbi:MAG: hypothetical protein NC824_01025 [Candidatus Omnitrophica bacterium]|nr:hypothetical protein [Candidatus Omnitrophota bacterium]
MGNIEKMIGPVQKKRVLGIDENGLGPLMGPLVITGILLRDGEEEVWFDDISDSKEFFSRDINNFSRLEETVVALFYLYNKKEPDTPSEILKSFCKSYKCLSGLNICTCNIPDGFIWSTYEGRKKRCEKFKNWVDKNGIKIEWLKSIAQCPKRINDFIGRGNHKFLLDLFTLCDIVKDVPDKNGLFIYGGKIGGLKFYRKYLRYRLPEYQCSVVEERDEVSLYIMEDKTARFTLGFYRDVEEKTFSAALSSLVGKYIRELFMIGIRKTLGISEDISGYYDSKTLSFVKTNSFKKFPSECLFRLK